MCMMGVYSYELVCLRLEGLFVIVRIRMLLLFMGLYNRMVLELIISGLSWVFLVDKEGIRYKVFMLDYG